MAAIDSPTPVQTRSRRKCVACLTAFLAHALFPGPSRAERDLFGWAAEPLTGAIVADRPGFSASPETVPRGRLQIEGGYQFTADRHVDSHALPLLLVRAGINEGIELRGSWDGSSWTEDSDGFKFETSDMSLGIKVHLVDQSRFLPALGLLASLSLPTGAGSSTSDSVDPSAGVLASYGRGSGAGIFWTVLTSSTTGDDGRVFEATNAIEISLPISARLGSYLEYAGFFQNGDGPTHSMDGGLTYLVTDNLQADINGGCGINGRADDCFLGTGFALRF